MLFALALVIQPVRAALGQAAKPRESSDREERQTQTGLNLLRKVLKEAEDLRLVENRAYVYKSAAVVLSRRSPEESVQLLERALIEINTALAAEPTA